MTLRQAQAITGRHPTQALRDLRSPDPRTARAARIVARSIKHDLNVLHGDCQ